ncbi:PD-(D/E)XK nuclease family protein [Verrucomicrobium sp. 3C]|uniref:PD-(D/E)XK nuclease family protein n=1 Tax=Verrucomicrobium sp. 3C TaxID=1134055 RepID=UPI0003665AC1|nr:PD-(D/E)XK nuclease family protein [Verrucomicrobium sp. 3C]
MERRPSPYVWATWAAKVMAGDANCLFAYWLRANYRYIKLPSSFDLARWTADHTALVQKQAQSLRDQGWEVKLESENSFNLQGRSGTIGGKPDIVAFRDGEVRVWDAKTGKQRHSDAMQVWIYLVCLPHLVEWSYKKLPKPKAGTVLYADGTTTEVVCQGKEDPLMPKFQATMALLAKESAPVKSPSFEECRFCDIPKDDCPDRVEEQPKAATTNLF